MNSHIFPLMFPKESFPSVLHFPRVYVLLPQLTSLTLQLTWISLLQTWPSGALAGWSLALAGWSLALPGLAWGWHAPAVGEAGAASGLPQTPGWAFGLGEVHAQALPKPAFGAFSVLKVNHEP